MAKRMTAEQYKKREDYLSDTWEKVLTEFDPKEYGMSALTTYWAALYIHKFTQSQSKRLMMAQIAELGKDYPGGEECTKYRGKERIAETLVSLTSKKQSE